MPRNKSEKGTQIVRCRVVHHAVRRGDGAVVALVQRKGWRSVCLFIMSGRYGGQVRYTDYDPDGVADLAYTNFPKAWLFADHTPGRTWTTETVGETYDEPHASAPEWALAVYGDAKKVWEDATQ